MSIIGWIILGLIAGYIGSKIVNKEGQGFWPKHDARTVSARRVPVQPSLT